MTENADSTIPLSTDAMAETLPGYEGQLVHHETIPAREGQFVDPTEVLGPDLAAAFEAEVGDLFSHQAAALGLLEDGEDELVEVVVASGDALTALDDTHRQHPMPY